MGSGQSNAMPMAYLNLAVAEALDAMCARLEARLAAGEDRNEALLAVVREVYADAKPVVFNGNNYDEAWLAEAARRGLPNEINTPAAIEVLVEDETAELFARYNVLQPHEVRARHAILIEKYNRWLHIEATQLLRMAKKGVLPAVWRQQKLMAEAWQAATACGVEAGGQQAEVRAYATLVEETIASVNAVRAVLREAPDEADARARAAHWLDALVPAMNALRSRCDALERRTDEALWPYPSYHEMLFR